MKISSKGFIQEDTVAKNGRDMCSIVHIYIIYICDREINKSRFSFLFVFVILPMGVSLLFLAPNYSHVKNTVAVH